MAEIYQFATEYRRMAITIAAGGDVEDILAVGIALRANPNDVPDPGGIEDLGEFTAVTLDDAATPPDILALIGPRGGDLEPTVADWQVFTLVRTADEDIIDQPDTLTVVGTPA